MFEAVSSPCLLAEVLTKLIESETRINFVKVALQDSLYVDNSQFADNCKKKLVQFYKEARRVMMKGNFNLRQWSTNCDEVK